MAEVALRRVLWDPLGVLGAAKARTVPYPDALAAETIRQFFWEADFSLKVIGAVRSPKTCSSRKPRSRLSTKSVARGAPPALRLGLTMKSRLPV